MPDEGPVGSRGGDGAMSLIETHGLIRAADKAEDLEVISRTVVRHRGGAPRCEKMNAQAISARAPQVALVKNLAHPDRGGMVHNKQSHDVEVLLMSGIDVICTVNVQHLESRNDVVTVITDIAEHEAVPGYKVRAARQVELVDSTRAIVRCRLAHFNNYRPEVTDASLSIYVSGPAT